jgi:hypothetical protein
VTPQQFGERFSMLLQVTEARDPKQQAALVRSLRTCPKSLQLLPDTVQTKATALKEQLLLQLGVDPEQTQQLISRHPKVLKFQADSLVQKATEQGQLLELEAADVVLQWWTTNWKLNLIRAGTQLLHARLAQLQQLLQPYMSPADVRQLVLLKPTLLTSSPEAVGVRLAVLQECLPDCRPQQLGAALLPYSPVLTFSSETIRHRFSILTCAHVQFRDHQAQVQHSKPVQRHVHVWHTSAAAAAGATTPGTWAESCSMRRRAVCTSVIHNDAAAAAVKSQYQQHWQQCQQQHPRFQQPH